ncbi:hypothetical protein GALMADRAFT_1344286 [Galerina marginata CBS 339.88]|uniref:Uncharacterized protein n=1 Tax=Galerina marginata (strain CBS 339.88) TaxID=685588 RepID=A0A067SMB6_GALM3|nr:hypothetical protein GALMADRAFT_1344286 [Galerina marginata CBS 339.88]
MKFTWTPILIAFASRMAEAATPASIFEAAHVDVATYTHDINVFASAGQPAASSAQLQDNGPFSASDSSSLEAIAAGIENTMSGLCHAILTNILPTANTHFTNLLTEDLSSVSSAFDDALTALEVEVTATVKTQIASVKSSLEAYIRTGNFFWDLLGFFGRYFLGDLKFMARR